MSTTSPFPLSAALPTQREFRAGAHQALLAANGRDTFYTAEIQRAIAGPGSPLERFLPNANYSVTPRVAGTPGGGARVSFAIPPEVAAGARPLRGAHPQPGALALPRTEIEAFAEAVRRFLTPASDVTPLQQQCRREFRLPDPAREPDAYWVVGTGFDRRLLILWGCERFARTSVPLDRVVEHLRGCEMAWEDKQQLAVQLATAKDEPLSRFLARHTKEGLAVQGVAIPTKNLKPFAHFGADAWRAYNDAARAFVRRADEPGLAPFEAELRREFRVPSLAAAPARFYRHGAHVLIDISPLDRAQCVPPAASADEGSGSDGTPLNEQLKRHIRFQGTPVLIGAGAALVAILGGVGFWLLGPDREPPKFVELSPEAPLRLVAVLNEPASDTLPAGAVLFVDDARKVAAVRPDPADPARLVVELDPTTPMIDGESYGLVLTEAVTDRAGNPLPHTSETFNYYDTAAPTLVDSPARISAGGMSNHDLVLTFTKPIADTSLAPNAFIIQPLSGGEGGKRVPIRDAKLDPDTKNGTRVIVTADEPFQSRVKYSLSLRGVTDRAKRPNRAELENQEFEYIDLLPPSARSVLANGAAYRLQIEFSKPLDRAAAVDLENYLVHRPGSTAEKPLLQRLSAGGATLDESGRIVTLALERGALVTGKHRLVIVRAADDKGNRTSQPIERDFEFADSGQSGSPRIATVSPSRGPRLELEFDRGLGSTAGLKDRFRILNAERQPVADLQVTDAAVSTEDSRKVVLTLNRVPDGGVAYHVRTEGLEDVFGARQTTPEISAEFRVALPPRPILSLTLSRAPRLLGVSQIVIFFDNVATRESVENIDNYLVRPPDAARLRTARFEAVKNAEGRETQSQVTLTFDAALPAGVEVGVNRLQFQNDQTEAQYRIRPVRVKPAQP